MNKDLEALVKYIRLEKEFIGNDTYRLYIKKNGMEDLEQALQRLESIDNAKPSEALECLEIMYEGYCMGYGINDERFNTIKQALIKAQEQEKVLSIIKEKRIDIESFYKTFIEDDFNYLDYQIMYGTYGLELLAKEEFDLLKRWLG